MLIRRILRIKAFKTIFCYAENPSLTLKEALAFLDLSCESTRDLYLFMLSLIGPLTKEASARIEAARKKFNPSAEELNPNLKFVHNRISARLEQDPDFVKIISKKKLSWEPYDVLIRDLYEAIKGRDYFQSYMESGEGSLKEDAALWVKIFTRELVDNPKLDEILEELSLYWTDDLEYALSWCNKSLMALGDGDAWSLPPLYNSELPGNEGRSSDRVFVADLLRAAYLNFEDFSSKIVALTPKWNRDRLCVMDLALIICGMAEAKSSPDTPIKAIINEYVEISKYYSTPESSGFVNGLLDKLINTH